MSRKQFDKGGKSKKRQHKIAIVNNADLNNPEHFIYTSVRKTRAVEKAREMRLTNKHVMLFKTHPSGDHTPVSLKPQTQRAEGISHNGMMIGSFKDYGKQEKKLIAKGVIESLNQKYREQVIQAKAV